MDEPTNESERNLPEYWKPFKRITRLVSASDFEHLSAEELREALAARINKMQAADERWTRVYRGPEPLPFSIEVRARRRLDGRLVCTGVRLGDWDEEEAEVTQRLLRQVKILGILEAMAGVDVPYPVGMPDEAGKVAVWHKPFAHGLEAVSLPPRVRPGPAGHTREFFEGRALPRIYADALRRDKRRPARYVAGALYISEPTAYRWIRRAKSLGLLPDPATREKP